MKELIGKDLFDQIKTCDAIAITTNCSVMTDKNGNSPRNPMGALAGAAALRWPDISSIYGHLLMMTPNVPVILGYIDREDPTQFISALDAPSQDYRDYCALIAFPTMALIGEPAEIELVQRSAELLVEMADLFGWKAVATVRAGCGVGGLSWDDEVKPVLEDLWDKRFIICHLEPKKTGFIKFGEDEEENITDGEEDATL
jgi:hypothetical protein